MKKLTVKITDEQAKMFKDPEALKFVESELEEAFRIGITEDIRQGFERMVHGELQKSKPKGIVTKRAT